MSKEAISLFHSMRQAGACPDKITLVGVLSACAAVGALELGTELDRYASQRGFYNNVYVGTALVDMYSKCGDLIRAVQVFGKLPCKNELHGAVWFLATPCHILPHLTLSKFDQVR